MPDSLVVRDGDENLLAVVVGVPENGDTHAIADQVAPQGWEYAYRVPFTPLGIQVTQYDNVAGNQFKIRLSTDGSVIVGFNGMTRRFTREDFLKLADKFSAAKARLEHGKTE